MSKLLLLAQNDFRLAYRDPMLRLMLGMPLLILLLVWFVIPLLIESFPALADAKHIFLMGACLQTPVMFGFINGFLYLEEKEQGVYLALQLVPLPPGIQLLCRSVLGISISLALNLVLLLSSHLLPVSWLPALLLSLHYSVLGPCLSLLLLAFAQNKVQGMAQMKVYNLIAILPLLVYFLPQPWMHVLAIVPTYWSFQTINLLAEDGWITSILIGFALYGLYLGGLLFWLNRQDQA